MRVAASGLYHCSHAARRSVTSRGPIPVTRTSLAGGAVVAVAKRWRANRSWCAPASRAARSTPGRHEDVSTVGRANSTIRIRTGLMATSRAMVTPRRRIHPAVEKTDMYMWSSTKIWSRSTDSRSRCSGRSWWAMVLTEAWRRATWDSRAMVTRSRKRRCTRADTVVRNQVATAATPRSSRTVRMRPASPSSTALASTAKPSASIASGSAASRASPKATLISAGSCW